VGVHSAGERRMEAALAAAAGPVLDGVFFSLRFGAEHGVVPMARNSSPRSRNGVRRARW
jgi:hypothetical protein